MQGPPMPPGIQPPGMATSGDRLVCERLLAGGMVAGTILQPIPGPVGCGLETPFQMSAILVDGRGPVAIEPPVTVRCSFAIVLAAWVRQDLVPAWADRSGGLIKLVGTNGYECRGRNRVAGARLSEHASGNAIDLHGFGFADRSTIAIAKPETDRNRFDKIKASVCARFRTILGPGSDVYHADNLHLDLLQRRNDFRLCQWNL